MNLFSKYRLFYCTIKCSSSLLYNIDSDSAFISGNLASSKICMKVIFGKLIRCSTYEYFIAPSLAFFFILACEELSQAIFIPDIFFQLAQLLIQCLTPALYIRSVILIILFSLSYPLSSVIIRLVTTKDGVVLFAI